MTHLIIKKKNDRERKKEQSTVSSTVSNACMPRMNAKFDIILCCDCVYEPLYGKSYLQLLECISVLGNSTTLVYISIERRDQDGVETFLLEASKLGDVKCIAEKNDNLFIYQIQLKGAE